MQSLKPVLIRNLELKLPGFNVFRAALNRHLRDSETVAAHSHDYDQILLYLSGGGVQQLQDQVHEVRRGALFVIPRNVPHAFRRTLPRSPLALTFDFQMDDLTSPTIAQLTSIDLIPIRQHLSRLARIQPPLQDSPHLQSAGIILEILSLLLQRKGSLPPPTSPIVQNVQQVLSRPQGYQSPPRELARRTGYALDYLNRVLKRELGLSLGQLRDQKRLQEARKLLEQKWKVGEVSDRLGFHDQNYFARWFHKQTGLSPSHWMSSLAGRPVRRG